MIDRHPRLYFIGPQSHNRFTPRRVPVGGRKRTGVFHLSSQNSTNYQGRLNDS